MKHIHDLSNKKHAETSGKENVNIGVTGFLEYFARERRTAVSIQNLNRSHQS